MINKWMNLQKTYREHDFPSANDGIIKSDLETYIMQKEITERIPLLDEEGNLTCAGFAKKLLPVMNL